VDDHPKVLIIEDDEKLVEAVELYLSSVGYGIEVADTGLTGLQKAYSERPDLIVLDIMLPELDGWEVCERVREVSDVPIVMLTARGQEAERVRGLKMGADDYLVKPFSLKELDARIQAVLRRAQWTANKEAPPAYKDDYLEVNLADRRVYVDGESVELTPTEYQLFAYLVENANRVLSYKQLLQSVWGWEYTEDHDYIRVYIWRLRRKIERDPRHPKYLITEHGIGYRFDRHD
jgi:two-component system KDP operon response regulator KdpE